MDQRQDGGFGHAFVSILAAGLLTIQSLFVWTGSMAVVWYAANDQGFFILLEAPSSLFARIAIVAVQVIIYIASLVIAPWVAWTYLRSEPRRPTRKERFGAGFLVVANFSWVFWLMFELDYWPTGVVDVAIVTVLVLVAVLVTSISFSRRPVGLSAG